VLLHQPQGLVTVLGGHARPASTGRGIHARAE
jgi:hypothetical protein